jgi:hypothetical protein
VSDLAVEVAALDAVIVDDPNAANSGAGKVDGHGASKATCADNEDGGTKKGGLAGWSNVGEDQLAAVARDISGRQLLGARLGRRGSRCQGAGHNLR